MILIKLSITVMCFNQENFIKKTLDSVLQQDVDFNYEIIIGDDASSDKSQKIIQEYANKFPNIIKPILREKNVGHTSNYIDITKSCKGEYIAHIDGDDLMLPGKLQKQVDYLDRHPKCSIIHHPVNLIDINGKFIGKSKLSKGTTGTINDIAVKNRIVNSSNMFRNKSLDHYFYDMDKNLVHHDWLSHIIKAQYGTIDILPYYLGSYRVYKQSIMHSTPFVRQCNSIFDAMNYARSLKNIKEKVNEHTKINFTLLITLTYFIIVIGEIYY